MRAAVAVFMGPLFVACAGARVAPKDGGATHARAGSNDAGLVDGSNPEPPACADGGLSCYVPKGCTTTLSGVVYDPAGRNPLYNAVVFVPDDPQGALPAKPSSGPLSNPCDLPLSSFLAVAATDQYGHFTLTGVPATTHVPLVVQGGNWRREVFLPPISACVDNPVPASLTRLPRNQSSRAPTAGGGCTSIGAPGRVPTSAAEGAERLEIAPARAAHVPYGAPSRS